MNHSVKDVITNAFADYEREIEPILLTGEAADDLIKRLDSAGFKIVHKLIISGNSGLQQAVSMPSSLSRIEELLTDIRRDLRSGCATCMPRMNLESRTIWFWQVPRYSRAGWCVNRISFRSHWSFWFDAFDDLFKPRVVRSQQSADPHRDAA